MNDIINVDNNNDDGYKDTYPLEFINSIREYGSPSVFIDEKMATPSKIQLWRNKYPDFANAYVMASDIQLSFINKKIKQSSDHISVLMENKFPIDGVVKYGNLFTSMFNMHMKVIELEYIKVNKINGKDKDLKRGLEDIKANSDDLDRDEKNLYQSDVANSVIDVVVSNSKTT